MLLTNKVRPNNKMAQLASFNRRELSTAGSAAVSLVIVGTRKRHQSPAKRDKVSLVRVKRRLH